MRKIVPIIGMLVLLIAAGSGCGDQKADDDTKVPLEVKKAESMDSTRLDSALADTVWADSMPSDSAGQ